MKADWKKMGFNTEEEYNRFLDKKLKEFVDRIGNDRLLVAVFKRLKDR
jgi:retron-type reverse transcriptase